MFDFYMDAHMHFDLYDERNEILKKRNHIP